MYREIEEYDKHHSFRSQSGKGLPCRPPGAYQVLHLTDFRRHSERGGGAFISGLRRPQVHTLVETWLARLWAVLVLGHAGTDKPTGQQEMENDSSLAADDSCAFDCRYPCSASASVEQSGEARAVANATGSGSINRTLAAMRRQHSGNYGFLFLFHFKGATEAKGCLPYGPVLLSWGRLSLFSAFSLSFT
jgi:hypothetical protein